jgi:hypothetical protein
MFLLKSLANTALNYTLFIETTKLLFSYDFDPRTENKTNFLHASNCTVS